VHFCNSYALLGRNLVLTLSYLTKTPHLNGVYYAKQQAEIGVQIMDNLTCNFNRTRVLFWVPLC